MFKGVHLIIVAVVGSAVLLALLIYWQNERVGSLPELKTDADEAFNGPLTKQEQTINNPENINDMNPTAIFKTNLGDIELELFEDQMPITVGNFIKLSEEGFYNDTKFHRVIEGFMIQGGDSNSKSDDESSYGTGGPGYNIQDEFVEGELLTNTRGTIAMANTGQPNSGGSQFFINLADNTPLDFNKEPLSSRHPVFGRVIKGMDVVDSISGVDTKERDIPVEPIVIQSVTIVR